MKNFEESDVSTGYDASATSVVLSTGGGASFDSNDLPFDVVWWNKTDYSSPTDDPNREIVTVTAIASDTLTVTRGQQGISATTKNTSAKTYRISRYITAKIGAFKTNYITSDQTTTSATAVNVTGMLFPIAANEVWAVEFWLGAAVTAVAGVKVAITVPTSATLGGTARGAGNTATHIITVSGTLTSAVLVTATGPIIVSALIQNSSNAGNVQLQFASGDGTVTATVKGGQCYFIARRLA